VNQLAAIAYPDLVTAQRAREELVDDLVERLKPYGGEVVHTSLSTRDEQCVREALAEGAGTVGGSV
jgi:hypothetical protein